MDEQNNSPLEDDSPSTQERADLDEPTEHVGEVVDGPNDAVAPVMDVASTAIPPQTTPTQNTEQDIEALINAMEVILRKTARATRSPVYVEGALWFLAASCAWVITGLLFALITPQLAKVGILVPLSVGMILLTIVSFVALVWYWRQEPSTLQVAKLIQSHQSSWRNDIVSSLVFGNQLMASSFDATASESLARAHVGQTVKRMMSEVQNGHLGHLLPKRDLSPAAISLASAVVVVLLPAMIAPSWFSKSMMGSIKSEIQKLGTRVDRRPLVGGLTIVYKSPKYSGMSIRREMFTTGDIRGLQGTEITLETYGLIKGRALKNMELVFQTEKGEQARELSIGRDRRISTQFVLSQSGTYFFRAKLLSGTVLESTRHRTITVIPDKAPRIQILSHKGTIEVSPKDVLEIKYSAEDDFGLTLLQKSHRFSTEKADATRVSLDVPALQSKPREHQGSFKLDLSQLNLQPKDSVVFQLEATDNNTLTGPGVGKSEPLVLVVSSPDDKHLKNLDDQQALVEALVGILADFLENPVGERTLRADDTYKQIVKGDDFGPKLKPFDATNKKLGKLLGAMGKLTARLKEDPLMVPRDLAMFEALYVQLNDMYQKGQGIVGRAVDLQKDGKLSKEEMQRVATYASDMEATLEKGILRLEDLLVSQKMNTIQTTAKEIKRLKERLKSLLKQYKDSKDPELKKAIKREIQRLRQRMAELMQRMQMQTQRLPQEHVNMEALKQAQMQSDTKKMVDNFQDIEKLLDKDDIDGALKALDQMTANLDDLTADMKKSFDASQPESMQKFDKEVSKLMDDVNDLSALQKDVEDKTKKLQKQMLNEQKQAMNKKLNETTRDLLKSVEQQKRELNKLNTKKMTAPNQAAVGRLKDRLSRLEKSLKQQDIDQSLKEAKRWLNDMESLRFSMQLAQRYVRRPSERFNRLRDNLRQIRPMNKRGEEIVDDLQNLMDEAERQQQMAKDDQRAQKLAEQQRKVQQRAKQLEQRMNQAAKQYPSLKQKMQGDMQKAQKAMQDAQKGLEGRKMQSALDAERQSMEALRRMKQSMKDALKNQRQPDDKGNGDNKNQRQRVEIPSQPVDQNKAYRDNIKKGMKEERLKDYASDIESYYKSLVE